MNMSRRDYFAAHALQGWIASGRTELLSDAAVQSADALIAALDAAPAGPAPDASDLPTPEEVVWRWFHAKPITESGIRAMLVEDRARRVVAQEPSDLPTPERVAQLIARAVHVGGMTVEDAAIEEITKDRARRVVGVPVERLRAAESLLKSLLSNMRSEASWPDGLQHFFDFWRPKIEYLLSAYAGKEAQPVASVVGVPVERLRALLECEAHECAKAGLIRNLLAEYAGKEAQP